MRSDKTQASRSPSKLLGLILLGMGLVLVGLASLVYISIQNQGLFTQSDASSAAVPVQVNFPAPEVMLNDTNGNPVSLSGLRGKYVLVNSWATWCLPCKEEMPVLDAYYQAHKDSNFTLIAIEDGDPVEEVAQYARENKLSFTVIADPENKASTAFRTVGLPTSYLIDPDGVVRYTWSGAISREMLEKTITPLLEKQGTN